MFNNLDEIAAESSTFYSATNPGEKGYLLDPLRNWPGLTGGMG